LFGIGGLQERCPDAADKLVQTLLDRRRVGGIAVYYTRKNQDGYPG
jgi:hypothetical protein